MNIWILSPDNMPQKYGHLNRVFYFQRYLEKQGHNVMLFVNSYLHNTDIQMINENKKYKLYKDNVDKCCFIKICNYKNSRLKRLLSMFQYYFNLLKIADNFEKPDIILGSSGGQLQACVAAIKLSKKYKCKNIVEIRDLWPESLVSYSLLSKRNPITKILYMLEKWIYKKADKIIFTMEGGKDYILNQGWDKGSGGPIDLNKIYHINNGVDLEQFNYNKEHYKIDDSDLNNKDVFKVVYTGSIRLVNNLGMLIDVAKELKQKGYNKIKLLIWGTGNELGTLKQRVKDENLDNIIFKVHVEKKYIPYTLSQSNVNIAHYKNEEIYKYGVSRNKMFDYLAASKPVLNTTQDGYDIITLNNAGITIKKQTINNIVNAIIKFYNMPQDEYNKMCANALKTAKKYDFKELTDKLINIIEER